MKLVKMICLAAVAAVAIQSNTAKAGAYDVAMQYGEGIAEIARAGHSEEQQFVALCRLLEDSVNVAAMRAKTVDYSLDFRGISNEEFKAPLYLAAVATFIKQHAMGEMEQFASSLRPQVAMQGRSGSTEYAVIYMRPLAAGGDPTAIYTRSDRIVEIKGGSSGAPANALSAYQFSTRLGEAIGQDNKFKRRRDPEETLVEVVHDRMDQYFTRRLSRRYPDGCPQ